MARGEKNLSAGLMNLPLSLSGTLGAMKAAGHRTEPLEEASLVERWQRLLAPGYRSPDDQTVLHDLLRDGLADRLPMARYRAWLTALPEPVQFAIRERWGEPEQSAMVLRDPQFDSGEPFFVIPRLQQCNRVRSLFCRNLVETSVAVIERRRYTTR